MYLNLTFVPLIQKKKIKFGIFLLVNRFFISVPFKKKVCFLKAYFYFTFIIKTQNEIPCLHLLSFLHLSNRITEDLAFQF